MTARDPYRKTPRSMNEAYGPYAKLTTDEQHRTAKGEKRYAIISFIIIVFVVGVVAYFHKW